ncbi:hypothetical protein [uncultured Lacinutrix sp.]|uniref:hypothetical protein n=1 Tax=uncultured Lacinutrix sp. TaxID=574032 RepID=UPI00261CE477|nr:hypothetical protein [uncultured Lacinutrix sp.]
MKKITLLFACIATLFLTSCNFTEEITFNEDGSGEFIMNYDMGQVMSALKEMGMDGSKADGEKKKKKEVIDSVIYFKDMLTEGKDSIAQLSEEEQKQIKALETVVMKMKMNEETGDFNFGFGSTFKSLEELPQVFEKIEQAKKYNSKDNPQADKISESAFAKSSENMLEKVDYKYDGKRFSRFLKEEPEAASKEEMESLKSEMEEMGEMKGMFEEMSYSLVYNFPKKIKSVSNKNAKISNDGKTVTLKMNFMEMIGSPKDMNLDVVLED